MSEDPLTRTFDCQQSILRRLLDAVDRHALLGLTPAARDLQSWADAVETALALLDEVQAICVSCGTLPTPEAAAAEHESTALGDRIFEELSRRRAAGTSVHVIAVDVAPSAIARALGQRECDALGNRRKSFRVDGGVVISRRHRGGD